MKTRRYQQVGLALLLGFLLYCSLMIVIRLKITQLGYEFEELKDYERSLQEEQLRLRAELSRKLSPEELKQRLKVYGYSEPRPDQVIRLP